MKQVKHLVQNVESRPTRSDSKQGKHHKAMFEKNVSEKIRCTDDKHDRKKPKGQAIPSLPAPAP